jgi:hypothetical protein
LLILRDVLHGSIVDVVGLGNGNLLLTTWWMTDMAMSGVLLQSSTLSGKVDSTIIIEADMASGGSSGWWRGQAHHRRWWW